MSLNEYSSCRHYKHGHCESGCAHPLPGETIKGLGTKYSPGGKGANQAIAAALAGGNITMLGAVGTGIASFT